MKKVNVDFNFLSPEMIKAIAMVYKDGFKESDVISFSIVDKEMGDRVKLFFNDTMFLVQKELVTDIILGANDDNFLTPDKETDGNCDTEYC